MQNVWASYPTDYIAQTHIEEINLHGDPAIKLNPQANPDYVIEDSLVTFTPAAISIADSKMSITARILNIGSYAKDSLGVLITRQLANGFYDTLFNSKIRPIVYEDSVTVILNFDPLKDTGLN